MFVSCVVPARNEEGHLEHVINEVLAISSITDVIIVEGGSSDGTFAEAVRLAERNPARIRTIKQTGRGKFDAVQCGAELAREDFLLIWDADGTVPLDCTRRVVSHALATEHATMGNRLQGNREVGSMQYLNFLGNWIFALLWAPLLRSRPVDMLCGTKIVQTKVFENIPARILKSDPYGDFALIATARAMGYSVQSIPVNYLARQYGETNIRRWSGGARLFFSTTLIYFWLARKKLTSE